MINENQVVDYVCKYLEDNNYTVDEHRNTNEKGYDIVAFNENGKKLIIEAKGGTSSKPGTNRYGKDFNQKQVKTHVSVAIYAVGKVINFDPDCEVGIALPENDEHVRAMKKIQKVIDLLAIKVYWVSSNGEVTVE
ncbi:protein NO VEIN domain-containing protein [Lacrimispora algidixylanolytica]|uniref:Protein NO VEIN C-terminal domain-containing protein n=1 Tax=Lacrimispora algidixylanolytica TaxID=94868 RepID=A0A419SS58_9FIRM|nr:DUF3883 domain-containing protein [Lacrimispora algidixylanolytica]RKD28081.1 hypothetical protein BET01_11080 [Lacrimispora algidixylanolytica]